MESNDQMIACKSNVKDGTLMLSFADILHPHVIEVKFDVKYVNEHPDSLSDIHSLIAQLNGLIENTLDEMLQDEVLQNTGDKDA